MPGTGRDDRCAAGDFNAANNGAGAGARGHDDVRNDFFYVANLESKEKRALHSNFG